MKHKRIISSLLAFAMVFNMLYNSILPAFATGTDNATEGDGNVTTYTVTFSSSNHATRPPEPSIPATVTVAAGEKVAEPQKSMMENVTINDVYGNFVGVWYADADCTTKFDFDTAINSDTTLYFNWRQAVAVTLINNESSSDNLAFKVEIGSALYDLMKNIGTPGADNPDLTFKGWALESNTSEILTVDAMKNIIANEDINLVAQWDAPERAIVTLVPSMGCAQTESFNFVPGSKISSEIGTTGSYDGTDYYHYTGKIYRDKQCTQPWDFENDTVVEDITLYKEYAQGYVIRFDYGTYAEEEWWGFAPDNELTYSNLVYQSKTVDGYSVEGWYYDADFTQPVTERGTIPLTGNITFYAKFVQGYSVRLVAYVFDPETDITETLTEIQVKATGEKVTPPSFTYPENFEVVNNEWVCDKYDESGNYVTTGPWDFENDVVTRNMTIYASVRPLCTITFDLNGKTGIDGESGTLETHRMPSYYYLNYMAKGIESSDGYCLTGWYFDEQCTDPAATGRSYITGDTTLYAKWEKLTATDSDLPTEPETFKVSLYYQVDYADPVLIEELTVNKGSKLTEPELTIPENHALARWIMSGDGIGGRWYFDSSVVTQDVTITAMILPYRTVTFDVQGVGTAPETVKVLDQERLTSLPKVEAKGHVFKGWYHDAECTKPVDISKDQFYADTTLFAGWEKQSYTVTFNVQGKGTAPAPQSVKYGEPIEFIVPENITDENGVVQYTWFGWWKNAECTQPWNSETDTVTESTTLYAKWLQNFDVTYDFGGLADTIETRLPESSVISNGPDDIVIEHYTLEGWYTEPEFINKVTAEKPYTVTGNFTLYAKYVPVEYTVTFDGNGMFTAPQAVPVAYGQTVTLPTVEDTWQYTFDGWYTDAQCSTAWAADATVSGNTTLYAKGTLKTYTVSFETNGIFTAPENMTVDAGDNLETLPTPEGTWEYDFGGWYKDTACEQPWNPAADTVKADTTLYAKAVTAPTRAVASGSCGEGVTWTMYTDGELKISGTGAISDNSGYGVYKDQITKVTIESGITEIGQNVFQFYGYLNEVIIPEGVKTIARSAFDCTALTKVTLPSTLKTIGNGAFYFTPLKEIVIPDGVTTLEAQIFAGCSGLTKAVIPDSVTSMGESMFADCTALTDVTLSKKITVIPSFTFKNCSSLKEITISESVTSISNDDVFYGCTALTTVNFGGSRSMWAAVTADNADAPLAAATLVFGKYDITVEQPANGTVTVDKAIVAPGETVTVTVTPNENCELNNVLVNGDAISGTTFTATGDAVVSATFTVYSDVTFETNGIFAVPEAMKIVTGTKISSLPTPVGTWQYDFGGWYKDAACEQPWDAATDTVDTDTTLYAKAVLKTYTVNFETNGKFTAPTALTVNAGDYLTSVPAADDTWQYTFDGWYKDAACEQEWDPATVITEDVTLYAKAVLKTYTVNFETNGKFTAPTALTVDAGDNLATLPTVDDTVSHSFGGWYKDAECLQKWDPAADTVKADTTLYAKATVKTYTVTFDVKGIGTVPAAQEIEYDTYVANVPTMNKTDGYNFIGWFIDEECTLPWDVSAPVTGDLTVYAKWEICTYHVNVVYRIDSSTDNTASDQNFEYVIEHNGKVTAPDFEIPEGYGLRVAYYNVGLTETETAWNFETNTVTDNTYICFVYSPYRTITFDVQDRGTAPAPVKVLKYTMPDKLPTMYVDGYNLTGWYYDAELTSPVTLETDVILNDMTFYAKWEVAKATPSDVPSAPSHSHSWSTTRQSDATTHYYVCSCGEKNDVRAHTFNTAGNCTVCGYFSAAAVVQPTPTPTPEATPTPEVVPTPAPVMPEAADTTITEITVSEEVVETVKETVTVTEGTATVDTTAIEAIVEVTQEEEPVVIPLAKATEEVVNKADVSTEALTTVAEAEKDVVIELTDVTVKLDAEAVKAITEQAGGETIEIRAVKTETNTLTEAQQATLADKETAIIVTAQIFSDGEYIGDFKGGTATVMLPFEPEADKSPDDYKVYYIDEEGNLVEVAAEYVNGHMVFTTSHFSDYVIVYETVSMENPADTDTQSGAGFPVLPIFAIVIIVAAGVLLAKKKKA